MSMENDNTQLEADPYPSPRFGTSVEKPAWLQSPIFRFQIVFSLGLTALYVHRYLLDFHYHLNSWPWKGDFDVLFPFIIYPFYYFFLFYKSFEEHKGGMNQETLSGFWKHKLIEFILFLALIIMLDPHVLLPISKLFKHGLSHILEMVAVAPLPIIAYLFIVKGKFKHQCSEIFGIELVQGILIAFYASLLNVFLVLIHVNMPGTATYGDFLRNVSKDYTVYFFGVAFVFQLAFRFVKYLDCLNKDPEVSINKNEVRTFFYFWSLVLWGTALFLLYFDLTYIRSAEFFALTPPEKRSFMSTFIFMRTIYFSVLLIVLWVWFIIRSKVLENIFTLKRKT